MYKREIYQSVQLNDNENRVRGCAEPDLEKFAFCSRSSLVAGRLRMFVHLLDIWKEIHRTCMNICMSARIISNILYIFIRIIVHLGVSWNFQRISTDLDRSSMISLLGQEQDTNTKSVSHWTLQLCLCSILYASILSILSDPTIPARKRN